MASALLRPFRNATRRELLLTLGPPALIVVLAIAVAYHFVKPAPPKTIYIAVGADEGGSSYYAKRYKEILARDGVLLDIRTTTGSPENLKLLADEDSDVDVAFVQSGITGSSESQEDIVSLGSLAYIPLWVFYRGDALDDPGQLKGKRIAVGPQGSAPRELAEKILAFTGADKAPTQLVPLERNAAIEALKAGTIDAIMVVSPAESPAIQKLAAVEGIRLMSFARAEAYSRRLSYLTKVTLPRGVFDLAADVPKEDVVLVAPTLKLLAGTWVDPALATLLLRAATEVHGPSGLLAKAGEFPAPHEGVFPISEIAKRYYQSGVPFLQRHLPFWAASLVDRLWVMVLPFFAVLLPLIRLVPPIYRWRMRRRIYRWYALVKEIELELEEKPLQSALDGMLKRLDDIERAVNSMPTPLSYAENLYNFRAHLDLVRGRIVHRLQATAPVSTQAVA